MGNSCTSVFANSRDGNSKNEIKQRDSQGKKRCGVWKVKRAERESDCLSLPNQNTSLKTYYGIILKDVEKVQ